jgi:hypothetical protein
MADIEALLADFTTGLQMLRRRNLQQRKQELARGFGGGGGCAGNDADENGVTNISTSNTTSPTHSTRYRVAQNVVQAMLVFIGDHQREFRWLKEDLESAIPAEVLVRIAHGHDVRAVTNVLVILQLCVTEAMAFKGLAPIHQKLADQVCKIEDELELLVGKYGHTTWSEHRQVLQALVRDLGRENPQIRQFYGR